MTDQQLFDEPPIDYSDDDDDDDDDHMYDIENDDVYDIEDDDFISDNNDISINDEESDNCDYSDDNYESCTSDYSIIPIIDITRIKFDKLIGRGGFGNVYRGYFINNNYSKIIAIKEPIYFHEQFKSISMINKSLRKEARLQFYLNHPNIIKIHGLSFDRNKIYLIMEYASGGSLRELLTRKNLSPTIIINFAKQISSAMRYLHNFQPKPIIHRDLKSSNILLDSPIDRGEWLDKQIKLTDLGLAREFSDSSTIMTSCGTCAWMAPESITESKFSKSSDVWSFGVVLWELLTGEIPYKDLAGAAVLYGIGNRQLTLHIPKTCPEELKQILRECWQQNPKLRPSFDKIHDDLAKSSFNVIGMEQFEQMKKNWFNEIWKNLKQREEELKTREKMTRIKEKKMYQIACTLQKKSEQLIKREMDVIQRELIVLFQQNHGQQLQQQRDHKSRSSFRKKLNNKKNDNPSRPHQQLQQQVPFISNPKNFCHNFTVIKTSQHNSYLLQAKQLNKTWTPGIKIRPELKSNVYFNLSNSNTSSVIKNDDPGENENDLSNGEQPQTQKKSKMKKIRQVLKKILPLPSYSNRQNQIIQHEDNIEDNQPIFDHDYQSNNPSDTDDDDCEVLTDDFIHLKSNLYPLSQTYHGQTKYSQRKPLWEPFLAVDTSTNDDQINFENEYTSDDNFYDRDGDAMPLDYNYQSNILDRCCPSFNHCRMDEYSMKIVFNDEEDNEINNDDQSVDNNHENWTTTDTDITVQSTEQQQQQHQEPSILIYENDKKMIDDDLRQELDQFEQELQSMRL